MCFLRDSLSFESIVPSHLKKRHFKVINIVFCEIFNFFFFLLIKWNLRKLLQFNLLIFQGKNFHLNFFLILNILKNNLKEKCVIEYKTHYYIILSSSHFIKILKSLTILTCNIARTWNYFNVLRISYIRFFFFFASRVLDLNITWMWQKQIITFLN